MQSLQSHSLLSPPSCPNILSHANRPKINHSILHYSSPREDIFSNSLLSLRTCTQNENPKLGSCYHAKILKLGLEDDVFVANSLINMYAKGYQIKDAKNVFDHMPHRSIVSWTSMMSSYCRNNLPDETILLFYRMLECMQPNEFTLAVVLQACAMRGDRNLVEVIQCCAIKSGFMLDGFLQNSLIDAYAKSGMLGAAEKLLQRQCERDVVSWTLVISGCVCNGNAERALVMFFRMQEDGVMPNEVTMLIALQAYSEIYNLNILKSIHGLVLKGGWSRAGLVVNTLIEMYSTNGYFCESMMIFFHFCFNREALYPSSETMANLLQGCGNFGTLKLGEEIHGYLIKLGYLPCAIAENSLINMYAENGRKDSAMLLFRTLAKRDIISWNTMIRCFVKNGQSLDALKLLRNVHRGEDNVSPDFITMLTSLQACSDLALLQQGQLIHCYLTRTGLINDTFVCNTLIDMYAKSGRLDFAEKIFQEMRERDVGSWNSIIRAYGTNGNGSSALKTFANLTKSGKTKSNAITLVSVLSACAHAGLVQEGFEIFNLMEKHYGLQPSMEHFACMVDLLGRAGREDYGSRNIMVQEDFIHEMPIHRSPDIWGALLSASVLVGDLKMAERAAEKLAVMEPSSSIWRVALANAYAAEVKWRDVANIRGELRRSEKLKKEGGWSRVNVDGCEFCFMAGDTKSWESAVIYETVDWLHKHMQDASILCM